MSRIQLEEDKDEISIPDAFPDEKLWSIIASIPWYADLANLLASGEMSPDLTHQQRKKLFADAKYYYWEEPFLFKRCSDGLIRRCVPQEEVGSILSACHSSAYGGHHGPDRTAAKVLQSGFFWPSLFKDAKTFVTSCDRCQRTGSIGRRNEMPQNMILEVEVFDVWGLDFMGPFPPSQGMLYILVAVDYVSKWVEAIALANNTAASVIKFVKKFIFTRFGVPRAFVTDNGAHFQNAQFRGFLKKNGCNFRTDTTYHPQSQGQVEVLNRELKQILEKTI